eukprot:599434-Prorocentrum_minimum.AAC.1
MVDVKGYSVDAKGYMVDAKPYRCVCAPLPLLAQEDPLKRAKSYCTKSTLTLLLLSRYPPPPPPNQSHRAFYPPLPPPNRSHQGLAFYFMLPRPKRGERREKVGNSTLGDERERGAMGVEFTLAVIGTGGPVK